MCMSATPKALAERIAERIRREGPIPFDRFVDAALYDEEGGFYARGGGAWRELSRPDPFVIVDAGAGRGRLASDVLRAEPECSSALRYVLVERSAALRVAQRQLLTLEPADRAFGPAVRDEPDEAPRPVAGIGPIVTALPELPALPVAAGVVLANELLDNLPFRVVERSSGGWTDVRIGLADGGFVEVAVPAPPDIAAAADDVVAGATIPAGARLPVPTATVDWLAGCGHVLRRGFLVVIDYADGAASLAARRQDEWLRTYRSHQRGETPLAAPGAQDITSTVPAEHLVAHAARAGFRLVEHTSQAAWLAALGIDELVDDARGLWRERAAVGDLEALAARSRVTEAAALTDPSGLGAHHVFVFAKG